MRANNNSKGAKVRQQKVNIYSKKQTKTVKVASLRDEARGWWIAWTGDGGCWVDGKRWWGEKIRSKSGIWGESFELRESSLGSCSQVKGCGCLKFRVIVRGVFSIRKVQCRIQVTQKDNTMITVDSRSIWWFTETTAVDAHPFADICLARTAGTGDDWMGVMSINAGVIWGCEFGTNFRSREGSRSKRTVKMFCWRLVLIGMWAGAATQSAT